MQLNFKIKIKANIICIKNWETYKFIHMWNILNIFDFGPN